MNAEHSRPVAEVALFGAIAISAIGTGLFSPLALLYFVHVTELPLLTVGALTSAGVLISLPVPFVAGSLADRFGPRPLVIAGQLLQAAGFVGYVLARDPLSVFLVIATVSVGQRVFWSTFFTMIAAVDLGEQGGRATDRRFARVGMVQAAGLGVGALAAGLAIAAASDTVYLAITLGNVVTFAASAILLFTVPVLKSQAMTTKEPRHAISGYRALFHDRAYLLLIAGNLPLAICSVLLGTALPVFVADGLDAPEWIVGPLLALNTAILAAGQLAATRVMSRWTRTTGLSIAGAAWTLWGILMAFSLALPWPITAFWLVLTVILYAAAEIVHAPVSNAIAASAAPEEHRGSYLATFQYGFTIANLVVPIGFTSLFSIHAVLPWIVTAIIAAVAAATMPFVGRLLPKSANGVHEDTDGRMPAIEP